MNRITDRQMFAVFGGMIATFAIVVALVSHFKHDDDTAPAVNTVAAGLDYARLADIAASRGNR